jgi:hypothetical protein
MDIGIGNEWGLFFILARGGLFAGNTGTTSDDGINILKKYKAILLNLEKDSPGALTSYGTNNKLFVTRERGQTGTGREFEVGISWLRNPENNKIIPVFLDAKEAIIKGRYVDFFANFNLKGKRLPQVKCPSCGDPHVDLDIVTDKNDFMPTETFLSASCRSCLKTMSELDCRRDILRRYGIDPLGKSI